MEKSLDLIYSTFYRRQLLLQRIAPPLALIIYISASQANNTLEYIRLFTFLLVGLYTIFLSIKSYGSANKVSPSRLHFFNVMTAFALMGQSIMEFTPENYSYTSIVVMFLGSLLVFYHIMLRKGEINPSIHRDDQGLEISIYNDQIIKLSFNEIRDVVLVNNSLDIIKTDDSRQSIQISRIENRDQMYVFIKNSLDEYQGLDNK